MTETFEESTNPEIATVDAETKASVEINESPNEIGDGAEIKTAVDDGMKEACEEIGDVIQGIYNSLLEIRDTQYDTEAIPLNKEEQKLEAENLSIIEAASKLEFLLPAQEREAQRKADALLLAGKLEEAEAKRAEHEAARHTPEAMEERQRQIAQRIEAIREEKKAIARRVFGQWYTDIQKLIRATEHQLFIGLLDKSYDEMYAYQNRHDLGATVERPSSALIGSRQIAGLTTDERSRSAEFFSSQKWYR
jgi:polyhydroxyalkanoate synthesis regulator phasin